MVKKFLQIWVRRIALWSQVLPPDFNSQCSIDSSALTAGSQRENSVGEALTTEE